MNSDTEFEAVIGLEVHAQLRTRSKMFCGCDARYFRAEPNSHVCPVCSAMPGALPVINRRAVDMTVQTALALGCSVPQWSKFDRKNYPYPDLPKGYQISQYDQPIGTDGSLEFSSGRAGVSGRCGIVRVHLEEDTGKLVHDGEGAGDGNTSLIDYNRSGVPLMEIVSRPDLRSPEEARGYFEALRHILIYLDVCDGSLEEGSMRADVNVSVRKPGESYGTQVEIKNLNSFRSVVRALEYEIDRQSAVLARGEQVTRETRGWSERREVTLAQRTKEQAHDYRYFPEPDLPALEFSAEYVARCRNSIPELPAQTLYRLVQQYSISQQTAEVLAVDRALVQFFEEAVTASTDSSPTAIANWTTGELLRLMRERELDVRRSGLSPRQLGELVDLVERGTINGDSGKFVLERMLDSSESAEALVRRLDLSQISTRSALEPLVERVLAENEPLVRVYLDGKSNALQAILGKVMAASGRKADMTAVRALVDEKLAGRL